MVKMTLEQLRRLVETLESQEKYSSMLGMVYVSMKQHPNGREFLEFEQPCGYSDCSSSYHRYES